MKTIVCVIILQLAVTGSFGQFQNFTPKAVATPEQASFAKYGNIEVSNYTGTANISIPLYTMSVGTYQIPIVLRYHPSGIQIEQQATWVGLGWDLTVDGTISQQIIGSPDQFSYGYFDNTEYTKLQNKNPVNESYAGTEYTIPAMPICVRSSCSDEVAISTIQSLRSFEWARPNIYQLNIPGGGAQFYYDKPSNTFIQSGKKSEEFFIERTTHPTSWDPAWTIKDAKGNIYNFFGSDNEHIYNTASSSVVNGVNSKLSSITLASGENISFAYENGRYNITTWGAHASFDSREGQNISPTLFTGDYQVKYLSAIESPTTKVVFELSSTQNERLDLAGVTLPNGYGAKRLNAIHVWDKITNRKIRSFVFTYSYFSADLAYSGNQQTVTDALTKRLKLASVQVIGYKDGVSTPLPAFTFQYNDATLLPRKDAFARDHWGLFNGQINNTSLLPNIKRDIESGNFDLLDYYGNRMPDTAINRLIRNGQANKGFSTEHAKAAILTGITYPTGGQTEFEYEPHRFKNYRIFSAAELNGSEGVFSYSLVDMNTAGSTATSGYIFPDNTGRLTLFSFKPSFTRINTSINSSLFLNARIQLKKIDQSNNVTVVNEWYMTTQDLTAFNQNNTISFGPISVDVTYLPTDKYQVEAYLPDIPEFTPAGGSLIPVATASVLFSAPDRSTFTKESIGGGLRIKSVRNSNPYSGFVGKMNYKYLETDGLTTSGKLMSPVRSHAFVKQTHLVPIDPGGGVTYLPVDVFLYELSQQSYIPLSQDAEGSVVGYSRVEVAQVNSAETENGKTVFYYKNAPSTVLKVPDGMLSKSVPNAPYQENGLLDSVEVYANSGQLLKKTINSYKSLIRNVRRGVMLYDRYHSAERDQECDLCGPSSARWVLIYYPITTKWFVPESAKEINYYAVGHPSLSVQTNYLNYNSLGQLIKEETTDSKGILNSTELKYPADVVSPSPIEQLMITKKLYHQILQKVSFTNTTNELSKAVYSYASMPSGNILLERAQQSVKSAPLFDLASNMKYDGKDNLSEITSNQGTTSYIWQYGKTRRAADIINAKANEVFFESFEEQTGWETWGLIYDQTKPHAGRISAKITAPAGSERYNSALSWNTISLTQPAKYRLSGWVYSNGPTGEIHLFMATNNLTVIATDGISTATANQWVYLEKEITVPANTTKIRVRIDNNGGGDVWFDDLRLHPFEARMASYTYDPLIGITSEADINNRFTYYEYDALGRLSLVRDHDNNILKKICYNYAGQPEDCGIATYGNVNKSGTFTRNNCGTNGTGSVVTYNVAAGVYTSTISQADADQKAQNDVNTNGQAYANANGTCTWTNQAQSGNFTRNNCGTNGTGSTVTYTVLAGTHSSTISLADANQKAINAVNTGGQAYANANGSCTWTNQAQSGNFTRNNCGTNGTGSTVTFNVGAGMYSSAVSLADANQQAINAVNAGGQAYANANGTCTWTNQAQSGSFTRNNCGTNGTGSTVIFNVGAGLYSSTVSLAAANQQAINAVNAGGQNYANTNGTCTWTNQAQSGNFTRNNCGTNGTGSTVAYNVAAGTYSSTVSLADANQQAVNAVNTGGQAYANANATCTWTNQAQSGNFTRNNCATGGVGGTVLYTITANTYSSTTSLAAANQLAINALNAGGQNYANTAATCTWMNQEQTRYFTRNNCSGSLVGSGVNYTIPANTHSSTVSQADANQLAYNAATAAGQAYANANGFCYCHCTLEEQSCVNDVCETGIKVYTSSVYNESTFRWTCYYHYEFSNGSWSATYSEDSGTPCYQP